MQIDLWPIVARSHLVQAFRPGEHSGKEGPFRTLRAHRWATAGVNIVTRGARHASGRLTIFSVLNLSAARYARDGDERAALEFAKGAARVETSDAFSRLKDILSGKPLDEVTSAATGEVSRKDWPEFFEVLQAVANETRKVSQSTRSRSHRSELVTGKILESRAEGLVLEAPSGAKTLVPRWLGQAAHRENVGDALALVSDRIDKTQMVVQAFPAIEIQPARRTVLPFGRTAPVLELTAADARRLSHRPRPLTLLVPVSIEA